MAIGPIDSTLSAEELKAVMTGLELVEQNLSCLIGLTPAERQKLTKMGRKSQTFVGQALAMAANYPKLMPGCLDVEAAQRDLALFEALTPILQRLTQLQELVGDTQMLAGSEAYASARLAYRSAQSTAKSMGMDGVVSELSLQYRKATRKSSTEDKTEK
ncbi:hypothetical protein [Leptolyngbya sp. FACHB-261]|uniref:hypothetical protein n=1 Tax=Leptolyngbya sp. FACHB-261 TaxID=2692806 RepID=UPI0016861750|nr:hypothetical protein [Leptolyngbya sp. FACHB-261]MBD2099496.1 hypothetical protein [Leptolyngbya sp. FACHB-261]